MNKPTIFNYKPIKMRYYSFWGMMLLTVSRQQRILFVKQADKCFIDKPQLKTISSENNHLIIIIFVLLLLCLFNKCFLLIFFR